MALITPATAREMAAKAHESRRLRSQGIAGAVESLPQVASLAEDPFAIELKRAMDETLKELRDADNAKDRAACAQALKNLRETYHLVTGQAKPGVIRETGRQRERKTYSPPVPSEPTPSAPGPENG